MFLSLELGKSDVDGDTSISLSLELVKNPSKSKRTFSDSLGILLVFLDGSLIDTTAKVDQMTSGSGFTGVDVTDNDQ